VTELAIETIGLSKAFEIPHEQRTTFKEYFLHPFKRVSFERNQALRDISVTVDRGEFFGVIGPNGSGKSTFLKIIAGIYRADSGTIRVTGRISTFIELGVGFHPDLSARENVRIAGTLLGLTRSELDARFDDIVGFAELERFVDQKLKNYSSGMLARLAYSIAIQVPFDTLLLDEVLAVGDEDFQQKCFTTFDRFRAEGRTIVYVSHDLATVERFCDRVLLLEHGLPTHIGSASEVVDFYRQREWAAATTS
jgi:ABC-type polysaccharide/polyol phosphate transport system ATPase subunit